MTPSARAGMDRVVIDGVEYWYPVDAEVEIRMGSRIRNKRPAADVDVFVLENPWLEGTFSGDRSNSLSLEAVRRQLWMIWFRTRAIRDNIVRRHWAVGDNRDQRWRVRTVNRRRVWGEYGPNSYRQGRLHHNMLVIGWQCVERLGWVNRGAATGPVQNWEETVLDYRTVPNGATELPDLEAQMLATLRAADWNEATGLV